MRERVKCELNYARIYGMNGGVITEGYLSGWEFDTNHSTVTLWFTDGSVYRTSVVHVLMMHKE